MANPSLQIGNGKFAIKENDLLGYSSSGTRFFPIPITMTRATLGSRVNPSGLIEDVELLGSELVSCGDFECANPDGVWTRGTGWTIANGYAESDGTNAALDQTSILTVGKQYKLVITVTNMTASPLSVRLGDSSSHQILAITSDGTYTAYGVAGADRLRLRSQGFNGRITNISVKEATIDGLARVDYTDGTGSLLVEPQRTNVITYSEDFSNAIWTNTAAAISVNPTADLSPDGTLSGNEFDEGTSSNRRALFEDLSVTANQIHTLSVFVKKGTSDYFRLVIAENGDATNWTGVQVDLSDNSLSTNNGNTNSFTDISSAISSTDYNGYYRLQLTAKHSTVTNLRLLFCTSNGAAIASGNSYGRLDYTGTSKTVYVWGAQLEEGSYATSYIKTQGSSVTRNKDEYTKTGISDKINSEEGVLFTEMSALSDDLTDRYIMLSDGGWNNRIQLNYENVSNTIEARVFVGGSQQFDTSFVLNDITLNNKFAIKWKVNDFALWVNGVEVDTDSSGSVPSANTLNELSFKDGQGSNNFFGKVRQLQVYKTALSDSELATLTTL